MVLGGGKMSPLPHLPTAHQNPDVHVGALAGLSHIRSPDGLNTTFPSQGGILENGSRCGNGGQTYILTTGEGEEPPTIRG